MTTLPDCNRVRVPDSKVRNYLLDLHHQQNGGKAQFFAGFGFTREKWQVLLEALKEHAAVRPVRRSTSSSHGTKYVVECSIRTPDGRDPCIRSVWIVDDTDPPRLVTAYSVGN